MIMRNLSVLISISAFTIYCQLCSVIIETERICLRQGNSQHKYCYLFHNVHDWRMLSDEQQLSAMLTILKKREQCSSDMLHILVEKPYSLTYYWDFVLQRPKSVTAYLIEKTHKIDLKYTVVENAEIRAAALGAVQILQPGQNPDNMCLRTEFDSAEKKAILEDITVQSLFDEYHHYRSQIERCDIIEGPAQEVFKKGLVELSELFETLQKCFTYLKAEPQEQIIALAHRLRAAEMGHEQDILFRSLSELFAHLFDLNIFKRLILTHVKHIAIIAGAFHTEHLANMLFSAGGASEKRHGISFYYQPLELLPLNMAQLDIFTRRARLQMTPRTCILLGPCLMVLGLTLYWSLARKYS